MAQNQVWFYYENYKAITFFAGIWIFIFFANCAMFAFVLVYA